MNADDNRTEQDPAGGSRLIPVSLEALPRMTDMAPRPAEKDDPGDRGCSPLARPEAVGMGVRTVRFLRNDDDDDDRDDGSGLHADVLVRLAAHPVVADDGTWGLVPPLTVNYRRPSDLDSFNPLGVLCSNAAVGMTTTTHGGWLRPCPGRAMRGLSWLGLDNVYDGGTLCFGSFSDRMTHMDGMVIDDIGDGAALPTVEGTRYMIDTFLTLPDNLDLSFACPLLRSTDSRNGDDRYMPFTCNAAGGDQTREQGWHGIPYLWTGQPDESTEIFVMGVMAMAALLNGLELADPLHFLDLCYGRLNDPLGAAFDAHSLFFTMQEAYLDKVAPGHADGPDARNLGLLERFWRHYLNLEPLSSNDGRRVQVDLSYEILCMGVGWLDRHPSWKEMWGVLYSNNDSALPDEYFDCRDDDGDLERLEDEGCPMPSAYLTSARRASTDLADPVFAIDEDRNDLRRRDEVYFDPDRRIPPIALVRDVEDSYSAGGAPSEVDDDPAPRPPARKPGRTGAPADDGRPAPPQERTVIHVDGGGIGWPASQERTAVHA